MTDDVVNQVIQDEMSIDQDMMNNNQGSSSEQQQQAHHQEHFEEQIQQSISQSKIPATSFSKLARLQQQQEPEYDQLEAKELDGEVFDVQRKYQLEAIRGQVCFYQKNTTSVYQNFLLIIHDNDDTACCCIMFATIMILEPQFTTRFILYKSLQSSLSIDYLMI